VAQADGNAEIIQRSYDSEATGTAGRFAVGAGSAFSPRRRSAYVVTLRRAWLLYRLGRFAESVEVYGRAIALAPAAVEPRLGMRSCR
jgi:predicted RNA polymerase sigma factor